MNPQTRPRLFGLRHGQSEANVEGIIISDPRVGRRRYGLSGRGKTQVRDNAKDARLGGDTVILSSPFLRAMQTAHILAEVRGVETVQSDERLGERCFGDLEGSSDTNYGQVWELDRKDPRHTEWQVESVYSVWQRIDALWLECLRSHAGRDIVFVAHGDILSIAACGLSQENLAKHHQRFAFDTAELSLLWTQED